MIKIDIISGFLGAGKTTLIAKLLAESFQNEKVVLIENEFGEIGIDSGFLKSTGIEIREMNSGCICCSLVGDFGIALQEVFDRFTPDRVIIEPSGVGKLSDVIQAVMRAKYKAGDNVQVNCATAVVDVTKCKIYLKNFGEFYSDQIEAAKTIILTRTDLEKATQAKVDEAVALIRAHNSTADIVTTPISQLDGGKLLEVMEKGGVDLAKEMMEEMEHMRLHEEDEEEHHHHDHGPDCTCGCHDHDHDEEHGHHHHEHDEDDHDHDEHDHHHHDHDDHDHEDHDHGHHDHDHHDHHDHDHEDHDHDHHDHHHDHDHHGHDHHHHHHHHGHDADEIFTSWGRETSKKFERSEIEKIVETLSTSEDYGVILRSKGIVALTDGSWICFDMVPEQTEIRAGEPDFTGRLVVIGSELKEDKIAELFGLR